MLKFFKRIRKRQVHQGRLRNYLLYAAGEIILVVIGILLALQINNWNTERVEQNQMQEFAIAMIQDLRADVYETELRQKQMEKIIKRMDSARVLINQSKMSDLQNIDLLCLTWNLYYRPFQWKRKTMEQLKSSASLRFIRNDILLELIGEYDSFTKHLDEDFQGDLARVERIEPLILEVVNMNYSNITDMRTGLLRTISDESKNDFGFFDHPEFLEAQNERIPLLTSNQEDLDLLINNLVSLQFQYEIRANKEMNKLKSDAANLMELLTQEYELESMGPESANLN
jgi:hypothetical protein